MERIQVHTVVDYMQPAVRNGEAATDFTRHHARIADHRAQARAREQPPLRCQHINMIRIQVHAEPAPRAEGAPAVIKPLGVHAIACPIDIAAADSLVRLHQVKPALRHRLAAARAKLASRQRRPGGTVKAHELGRHCVASASLKCPIGVQTP
jgi:hypothetical protein